jgi:hypothetical protein
MHGHERDDRSAQSRLEGTGLALGRAAPAGTRRGSDRSRSRALETGRRSREVSLIVAQKIASGAATGHDGEPGSLALPSAITGHREDMLTMWRETIYRIVAAHLINPTTGRVLVSDDE